MKLKENEYIIKKSKFIGLLYNVESVEEINGILEEVKKENKKATHVCFAYKVGPFQKYSDDGEPSGTAGRPILNIIEKKKLENTLIIVVRYFGGIKLGAGCLVRAYNACASELFK